MRLIGSTATVGDRKAKAPGSVVRPRSKSGIQLKKLDGGVYVNLEAGVLSADDARSETGGAWEVEVCVEDDRKLEIVDRTLPLLP